MKIVVNDIAASSGGAMTVLKSFYEYIKENGNEHQWIFLLNNVYLMETDYIQIMTFPKVKSNGINKLFFDFLYGKKIIEAMKPDLVISLQNILTFGLKVPQFVYIHQSIPFQKELKFSFLKKKEIRLAVYQYLIGFIIKYSAEKADLVFVQTQWMKNAVENCLKKYKNKIIVTPFPVKEVSDSYKEDGRWQENRLFFYPTSREIYKNNECIYQACEILKKRGITEYSVELTLCPPSQHILKSDNIKYIGYLEWEKMKIKYQNSVLIFPSFIETIGLPLIEAKLSGAIILASDIEYAREVLQDYENAYFFNPRVSEQLAELMEKVINQTIIRKHFFQTKQELINGWGIILEEIARRTDCDNF